MLCQQRLKHTLKNFKKRGAIVIDKVGNYEKHPFFDKNALAAKAFLQKVGLPKKIAKKTI